MDHGRCSDRIARVAAGAVGGVGSLEVMKTKMDHVDIRELEVGAGGQWACLGSVF